MQASSRSEEQKRFDLIFWAGQALFLLINLVTVKDGHNWGDDFAQYIIHAQNMLNGRPYLEGLNLDSWVTGLPGYPLVLAGLMAVFGLSFPVFKAANALFWAGNCIVVFYIARRYLRIEFAAAASLILASSPFIFTFKQNVLSDILFAFLASASLWAYILYRDSKPKTRSNADRWFTAAMVLAALAAMTRHAGMVLFLVFYLSGTANRDKQKYAAAPFFFLIAVKLILLFWSVPLTGNLKELSGLAENPLSLVMGSFAYNILAIAVFLFPYAANPFAPGLSGGVYEVMKFLSVPGILFLTGWLFYGVNKRRISVRALFTILYFLSITLWPISDGVRYVLPLAGFAVIGLMYGVQRLNEKLKMGDVPMYAIAGAFLLFNLMCVLVRFGYNDDDIGREHNREMIAWVAENTSEEDRFAARYPRAIGLLAARQGVQNWFLPEKPEMLLERIKEHKIKYLIFEHDRLAPAFAQIIRPRGDFAEVWRNDAYVIYEVKNLE